MKHSLKLVLSLIGTVLCFGTAFASLTSDVSYSITIEKSDPRLAKVKVVLVPQDDLLYMNPGGDQLPKRWATFVQNLRVVDEGGRAISVTELPDAKWKMELPKKKKVTLSYEIRLDHENHKWSGGIDGVAFARDWGVFYAGRTLLILNGKSWRNIAVDFEIPANWKATTPWTIASNKASFFSCLQFVAARKFSCFCRNP